MAKLDSERPHRGHNNSSSSSSELFICFTARPSSSSSTSMRISSSKSILNPSPGRSSDKFREPTLAFSSSVTRRLRSNGSMKGGQSSPMFPTGGKKRGCAFENPEPSSPKVTCIGQVRVKSKKKKNGKRNLNGSFRQETQQDGMVQGECLPHRNQKWVHLPLTICEALRAFGAEFNCFLPCGGRSTCSSRERGGKRRTGSCGAAFARWLMALQEGEEEKRRGIEIVVGGEEKREMEIEEERKKEKIDDGFEEERVSICIPPKNALLLMRCRSEPLRMSALANRFWDSPIQHVEDEDEDDEEDSEYQESEEEERYEEVHEEFKLEEDEEEEVLEEISEKMVSDNEELENQPTEETPEDPLDKKEWEEQQQHELDLEFEEEQRLANGFYLECLEVLENQYRIEQEEEPEIEESVIDIEETEEVEKEEEERVIDKEEEKKEDSRASSCCDTEMFIQVQSDAEDTFEEKETEEEKMIETDKNSSELEEDHIQDHEEEKQSTKIESQAEEEEEEERGDDKMLPDCLLMMMFEPKLSMEVSKETWVSSNDFIRFRPEKPQKQQVIVTDGGDETKNHVQEQQEKTTIPSPAPSMAAAIEQKLVKAMAYEPLVLKRCKSEPLRTSSRLVPEACFWKSRQIEPHRPTTLGVGGAARVGF